MHKGTNLEHARVHNLRTVLETVRVHGPLSRAEVARLSDLTPQTISNLVHVLLEQGLIIEVGQRKGPRGRSSIELAINGEGAYCVGLDLDLGHLTGLLVDLAGEVHQRIHLEMTFPTPELALDLMVDTVSKLVAGIDERRIWGVGVGFPGPLKISDGVVDNVINPEGFPGWENVSVAEKLARSIDFAVYLENNATAAAIGESFYGAGAGLDSFFYAFLGVGLGGGIVHGRQPLRGWQGNAGEIGFLPVLPRTDQGDYIGRHFDLFRLYQRLAAAGIHAASPDDLATLFDAGDTTVTGWLETASDHLAPWLVAAEYFLDPEAIILGGAWSATMIDALASSLERKLPSFRSSLMPYSRPLLRAELGPDAAALGVATLPLYQLLSPFPTSSVAGAERPRRPADHPLVMAVGK